MVDVLAHTTDRRLPEELLLQVFQHLDPPTLLAVRQTCRLKKHDQLQQFLVAVLTAFAAAGTLNYLQS